jgi:hypothetical protein
MYSDYYFSLGLTFLRIVVLDWDKNKFKINSVLYIYLHSKLGVHETPTVDMKGLLFLSTCLLLPGEKMGSSSKLILRNNSHCTLAVLERGLTLNEHILKISLQTKVNRRQ